MEQLYTDATFDRQDFREAPLPRGEYENCVFRHCELSGADLGGILFVECVFSGCNLSMANLKATVFRDVQFKDCKMLGLHFEDCDTSVSRDFTGLSVVKVLKNPLSSRDSLGEF